MPSVHPTQSQPVISPQVPKAWLADLGQVTLANLLPVSLSHACAMKRNYHWFIIAPGKSLFCWEQQNLCFLTCELLGKKSKYWETKTFFRRQDLSGSTDSQIYWGLFIPALFLAPFKNSACISHRADFQKQLFASSLGKRGFLLAWFTLSDVQRDQMHHH